MTYNVLTIKWTTSRGRETYGWNVCTLIAKSYDCRVQPRHFRTKGGGYDMLGTVIGDFLTACYQDRLVAIRDRAASSWGKTAGRVGNTREDRLYGLFANVDDGSLHCDGGCGRECMMRIAEAIGVHLCAITDKRGNPTTYTVRDERAQAWRWPT